MRGPDDEDLLAFDDLFDAELGEVTKPEARPVAEPDLAVGSDIHAVPPDDGPVVNRAALDGIDAVLVAYLLDLDDATVGPEADGPADDHSQPAHIPPEPEVTKPERPSRR